MIVRTSVLAVVSVVLLCAFTTNAGSSVTSADLKQVEVFVRGRDGYHTYRIPSLLVTKAGTLLAFCEGRKNSAADAGDIDLLLKRSTDNGRTWNSQQVIWDDAANTCGNPCPVLDETTGIVWLLLTRNEAGDSEAAIAKRLARTTRTVWLSNSKDDGKTWSPPVEITSSVKDPNWGWYATGPGVGIQIRYGPQAGRMIIPCDHSYDLPVAEASGGKFGYGSHVIYSDDHGRSWRIGGVVHPKVNECQVIEVADGNGTLLLDMRAYFKRGRRAQSVSHDGGMTWTPPKDHPGLVEPVCQASLVRYSWPGANDRSRILFSNPANEKRRQAMTVRLSYDEGKTWPAARVLHPQAAAYSCLAPLPEQRVGCLYECGQTNAYERIMFASFSLNWLTRGEGASLPE